ncbi:hypothetical protein Ancab_028778 [Ancistrocladus abbreviatus]
MRSSIHKRKSGGKEQEKKGEICEGERKRGTLIGLSFSLQENSIHLVYLQDRKGREEERENGICVLWDFLVKSVVWEKGRRARDQLGGSEHSGCLAGASSSAPLFKNKEVRKFGTPTSTRHLSLPLLLNALKDDEVRNLISMGLLVQW